jgi:hypothetical protein
MKFLKTWGIPLVKVEGDGDTDAMSVTVTRSQIEAAAVAERRRFAHCDMGDKIVHHLYLQMVKRRARNIALGNA